MLGGSKRRAQGPRQGAGPREQPCSEQNRTPLRGSSGFQPPPPPRPPAKVSGSVGWRAGTSSLQKAGDVVAAAGRPHEGVGLHGDVGGHELGRVLATGPTAVPHTVVVHAKPGESSVGSTPRAEEAARPARPLPPWCPWPHVCPISWAMVKAVARPMSSLMLQLLSRSHMPPTGARPAERSVGAGLGSGGAGGPATLPGPHPPGPPIHCLRGCLRPPGVKYLVCHRACSYRCRCHSCGRRGAVRGRAASLGPAAATITVSGGPLLPGRPYLPLARSPALCPQRTSGMLGARVTDRLHQRDSE